MSQGVHGKGTGLLFGAYDMTRQFREFGVSSSTEAADATMFGAEGKEYVAGLTDSTVSAKGKYVGSSTAAQELFEDAQGQDAPVAFLVAWGGWRAGNRVRTGTLLAGGFDVTGSTSGIVATSCNLQSDGPMRAGVLLRDLTPLTDTTSGPTVDAGVASEDGQVQLHVLSNTRDSISTATFQHSTDGSTWADLATFTTIPAGGTTSEVVALAGTVGRYTRLLVTLAAGTGQLVATASLARN